MSRAILEGLANVALIRPLDYLSFVRLLDKVDVILTDSGGIQEEAPAFQKPVLVMRQVTERNEAVAAGTARLVGTDTATIVSAVEGVLTNKAIYLQMVAAHSPFGHGRAAERIVGHIAEVFGLQTSPTPTARRNRIPVDLV